ncbi:MAG: hypothetical protein UW94_C0002G0006 [Parcubacteria group bacterium GW2011_GWA2_45_14]|jgi:hypothetical protein|nr:MAG: hypothetical protein UW94_C0002G0006 [Parcubacteria group bacterium GW2011_GWA2_45_14]
MSKARKLSKKKIRNSSLRRERSRYRLTQALNAFDGDKPRRGK